MTVASLVSSRPAISIAERNTTSSRCCDRKSATLSSAGESVGRAAAMRSTRVAAAVVVFTSATSRHCSVCCGTPQPACKEHQMESLPTIELSGSHREIGRQHGEAARSQIRDSIAYYRESFKKITGLEWTEIKRNAPRWVAPIESYFPGITDEIRGIGEGAGVAF